MEPGISFREMLSWIGSETDRYEGWFATQPPAAWTAPAGSGTTATVRDLMFHTFFVDLRLGQCVLGQAMATPAEVTADDAAALFALARRGQGLLMDAILTLDHDQMIDYRSAVLGNLRITRRKIVAHCVTHHLRHMAQVSTLLRQQGFATDWHHDLLMSEAMG